MRVFALFLFLSLNLVAQDYPKYFYGNFVEAYYDKESEKPIYIFDVVNGNIIDTLFNSNNKNAYYKIAVLESEYGWLKLKNIQRLPDDRKNFGHKNRWVKSKNFIIQVDNYDENHKVYLYDLPSKKSNRIHKLDNGQVTEIIETSDLWAKVKFILGKKTIEGWLECKDQCAYPWTTCPKYD